MKSLGVPTTLKVFAFFLAIYTVTWAGHYTSGDGSEKRDWAKAMIDSHSSDLDPGPGVRYSRYGVGHPMLAVPLIVTSRAITSITGVRSEAAVYTFFFLINGAWFLALVARYLRPQYADADIWKLVLLLGLATMWWPYTKMDYSEPLVLTAVFWGFLEMRGGRVALGSLIACFAILIQTDALLLVGLAWLAALPRAGFGAVPKMVFGLAPWLGVMALANYARYGALLDHGYREVSFSNPFLIGAYGILFSAGKSVFLFSPLLIAGFIGWRRFRDRSSDAWFFLAVFVVELLTYARWWDWSADDSWGVRFMIPGVMLMTIPAIEVLNRRWLIRSLATVAVFVQLLAVLINGLSYVVLIRNEPMMRNALFVGGTNRADFEDLRFNPRYSQLAAHFLIIRAKLGLPPSNAGEPEDMVVRTSTPLYDTLPPETWRNAAAWDFIWMRR